MIPHQYAASIMLTILPRHDLKALVQSVVPSSLQKSVAVPVSTRSAHPSATRPDGDGDRIASSRPSFTPHHANAHPTRPTLLLNSASDAFQLHPDVRFVWANTLLLLRRMVLAVTTSVDLGDGVVVKLREERDNESVPLRTGCRVWSCARLLSSWLASPAIASTFVRDRDVLELGAGVGAVGLTCAALGASSVTMTDRDPATLSLSHANAQINGHYSGVSPCDVSVIALDWDDVSSYLSDETNGYGLIVAADALYLPEHCASLPRAVAAHVAPGGVVVIACGLRRAGLLEELVAQLRECGLGDDLDVDGNALALRRDEGDDDAAVATASEHAHDGEQIAAAGGYVLITARVGEDWTPPSALSREAVREAKRAKEEEEEEESLDGGGGAVKKVRSAAPTAAAPAAASDDDDDDDDADILSEVNSDANSAMGDFLDEFAELDANDDDDDDDDARRRRFAANAASSDDDDDHHDAPEWPPYRVVVAASETATSSLDPATIAACVASLTINGFVVVEGNSDGGGGIVPDELAARAKDASATYLHELLANGVRDRRGLDPCADIFRYAEVCSRARGGRRYDVTAERRRAGAAGEGRGPASAAAAAAAAAAAWDALRVATDPFVTPILAASGLMSPDPDGGDGAGRSVVTAVGCVTSRPGAPAQRFHADGVKRGIVNVFVPLVHVTKLNGPTAFKRGSHAWDHDAAYLDARQRKLREDAEEIAPELARGSLLMYDYAVVHAGGGNGGDADRPLAYVMHSRAGVEDTWNFPDESVWD